MGNLDTLCDKREHYVIIVFPKTYPLISPPTLYRKRVAKMKISKNNLVGFEQIVEMLKAKSKNNKSKNIYFSEKDINKYLSRISMKILLKVAQ